jgi:hypothetical protein
MFSGFLPQHRTRMLISGMRATDAPRRGPSSALRYAKRKKTPSLQERAAWRINEAGRRTYGDGTTEMRTHQAAPPRGRRRKLRERCSAACRGMGTGLTAVLIRDECRPAKDASMRRRARIVAVSTRGRRTRGGRFDISTDMLLPAAGRVVG